ncbi:hypothetical protein [Campylobacter concisus]|uniref:hypothetical protein n=1 Tax=Campylobacter concisus TaxID=199 RepID=UPI00131AC266|nr:hypothetical protein [Campylobacter concisus]
MERTRELLKLSIGADTPYQETLKYLDDCFEKYEIPNQHRINVLSQMLPLITTQFTITAMQTGLELTQQDLSFELSLKNLEKQAAAMDANIEGIKEQTRNTKLKNNELEAQAADKLENLKEQNNLLRAQIAKLAKEQALAESQQRAVDRQVIDNRIIKSMSVLGNFIAENQAGGMIVPSDMTKYLFNMVHALIKNDITIDENKNFTMTKK